MNFLWLELVRALLALPVYAFMAGIRMSALQLSLSRVWNTNSETGAHSCTKKMHSFHMFRRFICTLWGTSSTIL